MSKKLSSKNYKQSDAGDHDDDNDGDHDDDHDGDHDGDRDSANEHEENKSQSNKESERDHDDETTSTPDNQYPHSKVSNALANKNEAYKEMINKQTIYNIAANDLFPRIKFLDKSKDLEFSMEKGSICHYVFHLGKLTYSQNQEAVLWEKAKIRKWQVLQIKE